jgi:hypothetical protein
MLLTKDDLLLRVPQEEWKNQWRGMCRIGKHIQWIRKSIYGTKKEENQRLRAREMYIKN